MAHKEVKFSEDEIKSLKELQQGYLTVQNKFGQVQIAKITLQKQAEELGKTEQEVNKEFSDLQSKEQEIVDQLTEKYGQGTLDPKSGVFTPQESA